MQRVKSHVRFFLMLILFTGMMSACGSASTGLHGKPITIGISLSLSGDYSDDGKFMEQGYQLWAADVNKAGGLLGRPVALDILSDASSTQQVVTNYQKLINVDHVDLLFGPFSSLLTKPASEIANRYGYAFVEGAGTGPSVFNRGLHNLFCVSLPAVNYFVSFSDYILSLPAQMRPKTAVYATGNDPFALPQVQVAQKLLEHGGIRTVGSAPGSQIVWPAETTDYTPIAQKVIDSRAQIVILGTTGVQDAIALTRTFKQQHYNPEVLIESSGPDQVTFIQALGSSIEGTFVPNSEWSPSLSAQGNAQMVQEYVARYGGKPADVSSDVAQAYSVGQVMQQAVVKTRSLDNAKLIQKMHTDSFSTVQGSVVFDSTGQNSAAVAFLYQWQHGQLLPVYPPAHAAANAKFPKPAW
jgi:branched-chain amino acid transport system substrate-binding protein